MLAPLPWRDLVVFFPSSSRKHSTRGILRVSSCRGSANGGLECLPACSRLDQQSGLFEPQYLFTELDEIDANVLAEY